MTISSTLRRALGILSVLTSPLWFIPAVIVRGLGYARWDFIHAGRAIARLVRTIRQELVWAWKDEALMLREAKDVYVASPAKVAGKATAKATGSFLTAQGVRIQALAAIIVLPFVVAWVIFSVAIKQGICTDVRRAYRICFRALFTGTPQ